MHTKRRSDLYSLLMNNKNMVFQKEKMPNGKEVMAIAEQAYIAYAKHLLPKQTQHGEIIFNKDGFSRFFLFDSFWFFLC
jgi:hypothetical protein